MEIKMNSRINMTAGAMVLLLDQFGEELIYKVENGEIDDTRDIMAFARDKTVEYFNEHGANEEGETK